MAIAWVLRFPLHKVRVTLTRLAELVLTLNAFSFNNEFYHEVGGVATDSKKGPNYGCLFVGYVEEQIGQKYTGTVPQLHKSTSTMW